MNRKDFLKGLGLTGVASSLSVVGGVTPFHHKISKAFMPPSCILIPSETAGPFPLDLTTNAAFFRQDLREDRTGAQLNLKMRIMGANNCLPMQNVRVNIWACDKDGNYSGYGTEAGQTYLRGYQMTDANGECEFVTVFPGWYNGRICHIHFQVYVSSVYKAVSQLAFPATEKNALYADNSTLYTKGPDPLNFNTDMIFSDGYSLQVATLTPNPTTGGYDSFLEVTVKGDGVLGQLEPETGGFFKLGQNHPNPFTTVTTVPFHLTDRAEVQLDLFDLAGKKVATVEKGEMFEGPQEISMDMQALGIPASNYIYQLQVTNSKGVFRQCKMMTAK